MAIIFISLISLFLFRNSFSIYFFQDDWFLLSISKIKSFADFLHFLIPRPDVQFYRPLSSESFYLLGRQLFSLNTFGFHLIAWIFFLLNIFLVFKLAEKFIHGKTLPVLFTLLYATSAVHYNSLYWLPNFSYILSGFWYFFGFFLFLESKHSVKNNLLLITIFILGIFSNEFMLTFPVILFVYTLLLDKKKLTQSITLFFALFFIICFYLLIRLFVFKPNTGTYQFVFDKSIISSYRFFSMFFLSFPETMKDQMISFYKVNSTFLQTFSREFYIFLANLITFGFAFIILPFIYYLKNKNYKIYIQKHYRKIILGLFWFIITLLPIIFVPSHISPHQGTIALFGFLLLFLVLFDGLKHIANKYLYFGLIIFLITSWIVSTFTSVSLNDDIHWIKRRSDLSFAWIQKIKETFPTLPKNSLIQLPTEDKEVKVALNDGRAIGEVYDDESIRVIFKVVP